MDLIFFTHLHYIDMGRFALVFFPKNVRIYKKSCFVFYHCASYLQKFNFSSTRINVIIILGKVLDKKAYIHSKTRHQKNSYLFFCQFFFIVS